MKASVFIKVALIDQMQQIADLGLLFHLAKLIPSGVEVLARVKYRNENEGYLWSEKNTENLAMPDWMTSIVGDFYEVYFPEKYGRRLSSLGSDFFSAPKPLAWFTFDLSVVDTHLQPFGEKEEWRAQAFYVHLPTWFSDFKIACEIVLDEIKAGKIKDIEVLKTLEK